MRHIRALALFVWDFVVGDDWRIAAGVIVAFAVTAAVAGTIAAWWIVPVCVAALLSYSVWRVARAAGG